MWWRWSAILYVTATNFIGPAQGTGTAPNLVAGNVTINYFNNTNSTYQMLWFGTGVYGTAGIYCNPSTNFIQMVI
jgi:hypothetical protein